MGKRNLDKLSIIFDKRQKDFVVKYPRGSDGALAINTICGDILKHVMPMEKEPPFNFKVFNFVEELEKRGYDTTTLKFSCELKEVENLKT